MSLYKLIVLALIFSLQAASAAVQNDKSLLFESSPASKIIKSPNAEAIKKAEKLLSNGNEAAKSFPRTTVLDANASTLIRAAMDLESGIKTSKYLKTETAENPAPIATSIVEKPAGKYFEVLDKSYSSLENDSWADATANMNEVLSYFYTERSLHGKDNALIDDYCDLAVAFTFYLAAGTELDEAEQPNYEHAKSMFIKARNNAQKVQGHLPANDEAKAISQIIEDFVKKLNTEITYIVDIVKP